MTSILLSIVLILIITGLFFSSIKWGLFSIVPLTSAVILNFGLMGIFGIDLNHMTALLSSVIIGVGVDFSIHYISDYRRNLINNVDFNVVNLRTSQDVGYPVLLDVASIGVRFPRILFRPLIMPHAYDKQPPYRIHPLGCPYMNLLFLIFHQWETFPEYHNN